MIVVVHGRGVVQSGSANNVARFLATAASIEGKDAYMYGRYDDAPERVYIPYMAYAIIGEPKLEENPPEELEPIGEIFDAVVVLDSSMVITGTSQRATIFDGIKQGATIVVNSSLPFEKVVELLKMGMPPGMSWKGKVVVAPLSTYDPDVAIAGVAGVVKASKIVDIESVAKAFEQIGVPKEKEERLRKAYNEMEVREVEIRK